MENLKFYKSAEEAAAASTTSAIATRLLKLLNEPKSFENFVSDEEYLRTESEYNRWRRENNVQVTFVHPSPMRDTFEEMRAIIRNDTNITVHSKWSDDNIAEFDNDTKVSRLTFTTAEIGPETLMFIE